jgi:two-component system response regulator
MCAATSLSGARRKNSKLTHAIAQQRMECLVNPEERRWTMRRLKILHVEDKREDAQLLMRACNVINLEADFFEARSGLEAVAYLNGTSPFEDRLRFPLPDVIVLDLRMPGMDGFTFLDWIKRDPKFESIPVIVFTEAVSNEDKARVLANGAAGYFVKPLDFDRLVETARSFRRPQQS